MKVKFVDYHSIASNLVFVTFIIGIAIIFLRGLDEVADLVISSLILSLRYVSVFLIRRRFELAKYLLVILIARNIYRLWMFYHQGDATTLTIILVILQVILTVSAFILISRAPQQMLENLRKNIKQKEETPQERKLS